MKFELTILGISAATPSYGRYNSAQVLQLHNSFFLIDCGEGTQMRMIDFGIPRLKIHHIFISHLHGDHFFGLPGLLRSYALSSSNQPVFIYSPPGLQELIMPFLLPVEDLKFSVHFQVIDPHVVSTILEDDLVRVQAFPLKHRVPAVGFLFREKQKPEKNIIPEKIKEFDLSILQIKAIKSGEDLLLEDGRIIPNHDLTFPPVKPRSFAYVSDTAYDEAIVPVIKNVDLLYHETTFSHNQARQAAQTLHSTTVQAAMIAKLAGVGKLITGHYSSRYNDQAILDLIEEAKAVFPNTLAGVEGRKYCVSR